MATNFDDFTYEGQHGLILNIPEGGSFEGAEKLAEAFYQSGACEEKVDAIYNKDGKWIFVWPVGAAVVMPQLLAYFRMRMPFLHADSLAAEFFRISPLPSTL